MTTIEPLLVDASPLVGVLWLNSGCALLGLVGHQAAKWPTVGSPTVSTIYFEIGRGKSGRFCFKAIAEAKKVKPRGPALAIPRPRPSTKPPSTARQCISQTNLIPETCLLSIRKDISSLTSLGLLRLPQRTRGGLVSGN